MRKIISVLLLLAMLLSLLPNVSAATGTLRTNTGRRDTVCTQLSTQAKRYYTGNYTYAQLSALDGVSAPTDSWKTTQGNELYDALQALMSDTHTHYVDYPNYEANSLATYWKKTDAEAGSDTYLYFYTDVLSTELDVKMNREHIWPQSNASFFQKYGGADLHHLRPSVQSVNSAKSNRTFGDVKDVFSKYATSDVNDEIVIWYETNTDTIEVRDNTKGDVARILLYVYCRWGQPNLYSDVSASKLPTLDADDERNDGIRAIEDLQTLLEWCELDPVDEWEMQRNDQSENVQGNRNVFIDYPEFAWLIFGQTPPSDLQTPSGEAANATPDYTITATVNNSLYGSVKVSGNQIIASPNAGYYASGYQIIYGNATVAQDGNVFTVTASSDCIIRINFAAKTLHTLRFSVADSITAYLGDTVTLPSPTAVPEGYRFVGWTDSEVADTLTAPRYWEAGSSYTVSADSYFYALYSYSQSSTSTSGDYSKLSTAPEDWTGEYVIVYENEGAGYVFNASLAAPDQKSNYLVVALNDDSIRSADAEAYKVTVERYEGGYSVRTASGIYMGNSASGAGFITSATPYVNYLKMNDDGTVRLAGSGGTTFRFCTTSTQLRFRYYAATTAQYKNIHLYRKSDEASKTYYTTNTACAHKAASYVARQAATCTQDGLSAHYFCSTCGTYFANSALTQIVTYEQLILPATGHSFVYTDNGDKTHTVTCGNCDAGEIADCVFEDGKCICGAKEVVEPIYDENLKFSHSLTLENDISINFIGQGSALSAYDTFYLECKVPVYNGNDLIDYEIVNIDPVFNGTNYEFTLTGVTAKMMNNDIEAIFRLTKDGQEYYSKTDVYSVAEYAYGKLDSTKTGDTAELKTVCANLLRYGSMAQIQFNYRTDALVDADMTATHKEYLTDLSSVEMKSYMNQLNDLPNFTVPWKSATLELGNKVIMCLIANLANYSGDPSELTMRLSYIDSKGQSITVERPLKLYDEAKMLYAVSYDGLRATEMRTIVSAAIYLNGTRVSKTVEYSIESYGGRNPSDLCRAMLAYGDSANAFFAN